MTFSQWLVEFDPVLNETKSKNTGNRQYDNYVFEPSGDDLSFILHSHRFGPRFLWTLVSHNGVRRIVSDYRFVSRQGYFLTKNKPDKEYSVKL